MEILLSLIGMYVTTLLVARRAQRPGIGLYITVCIVSVLQTAIVMLVLFTMETPEL